MWSSRSTSYHRDQSSDGIQRSPYLRASSALLTPPSSFNLEARRNSTASTLSSLGPDTPIYGNSPFADHSLVNMTGAGLFQAQSNQALVSEYLLKAPVPDEYSFDDWPASPHSMSMEQDTPMKIHQSFTPNMSLLQSLPNTYTGMQVPSSFEDISYWSSFSTGPYGSFSSHMSDEIGNVDCSEPLHSAWGSQFHQGQTMIARTMVPSEAMLAGEYVHVDTSPDTNMSSYDDTDVLLPPSPEDVVFKQESDASEDERRVKRSIFVSPTGGKTVKREHRHVVVLQKKTRKSRSRPRTKFQAGRYEILMENDVEQIPGTKRWRRTGGPSEKPQICGLLKDDGTPCGKRFQRQEHLHRHMKTHSGRKDFACQLCPRRFNRNDNCSEHYWTHVHRPGKKASGNKKRSLRYVLTFVTDPKHAEKLQNKWRKEVGYEYNPEDDLQDEEEEEATSLAVVKQEDCETNSPFVKVEDLKVRCRS